MTARLVGLGFLMSFACGSAALASEADCAVIGKAMIDGGSQPGVRQTEISMQTGAAVGLEAIHRPDALHARDSATSRWMTVPYGVAERTELAKSTLQDLPVGDCVRLPPETVRGVATEVYEYTQRNPMTPEAETMTGRIWIGPDGLPLRMKMTDRTLLDMEYGDFPAPLGPDSSK